jgi:hypothetical protein
LSLCEWLLRWGFPPLQNARLLPLAAFGLAVARAPPIDAKAQPPLLSQLFSNIPHGSIYGWDLLFSIVVSYCVLSFLSITFPGLRPYPCRCIRAALPGQTSHHCRLILTQKLSYTQCWTLEAKVCAIIELCIRRTTNYGILMQQVLRSRSSTSQPKNVAFLVSYSANAIQNRRVLSPARQL